LSETAIAIRTMPDDEEDARSPLRRCAVRRVRLPKSELIRFVLGPDGTIVLDLKERLPGRGVWVSADRETIERAAKDRVFARVLHAPAKASAGLADEVERLLSQAALGAFSLAKKAGEVAFGFTKVEAAIAKGEAEILVHASDAAEDGCRKLDSKLYAVFDGAPEPAIRSFSAAELSLASGRPNVIHAAMLRGGAAARFAQAARRLERYRRSAEAIAHPAQQTRNDPE
jgi:uncharacterized protein